VHHGAIFRYLDNNFGEFLIIWDSLFGSFAEEKEKVVYGMYNAPKTWNPIRINFHYYIILARDAWDAPYFWDKLRIWFMPTGWRPRGLPEKEYTEMTPENHEPYRSIMFRGAKPYLVSQVMFGLYFVMVIMSNHSGWTAAERWLGAGMLWWMVFNWAGIMESKRWAMFSEMARLAGTAAVLLVCNNWYGQPLAFALVIGLALVFFSWCLVFFRPVSPLTAPAGSEA
jgi:hypothetical protein